MKTANWTSELTFKRFYPKPISSDFGNSVLSGKYFLTLGFEHTLSCTQSYHDIEFIGSVRPEVRL